MNSGALQILEETRNDTKITALVQWQPVGGATVFLGGSDGNESACKAGDLGLIPRSERFPGEGNGNPLQYSRLENSMNRGGCQAKVHGVTRIQM